MSKKVIVVEVNRFAKNIIVRRNKIIVPKIIKSKDVAYGSTASPFIMSLVLLAFILSVALTRLIGFFAFMFLVASLFTLWYIDKKRRSSEEARLRDVLPRETVLRILDKVLEVCKESDKEYEVVNEEEFEVRIRCGIPYKCIEYNSNNLKKVSLIYASLGTVLVLSYLFLDPIYLVVISVATLFIVVYTSRIPICEKFLIKKEDIKLELEG